jgi:LCP family protein required for cell wall assembly
VHSSNVIWILALGSDARLGENPERTRADAIHLIGVNLRTGTGADIGIPRDSWVPIDGHGTNRINAALYYGGPQLMAKTVTELVGVRPDYVFLTTFGGLISMVNAIGGVTVHSRLAFTDDNMPGSILKGPNKLRGPGALFFARARHFLPRGDFDRSANQQELIRAGLREIHARETHPGFMERAISSAAQNLFTSVSPADLYRLGQLATQINPARMRGCVVNGTGTVINGADVVLPDRSMARRLGNDARNDGKFDHGC